jgi:short-subunit dehydrogenase involved in D-alanine esterification of teichoic acids
MKILIAGGTDGIGLCVVKKILEDARYSEIFILGRKFEKVDAAFNV